MISILLPTCHRLSLLENMLKSLDATVSRDRYEIIAVVDEDYDSAHLLVSYNVDVLDYSVRKRGALWSWNRALQLSDGDILVPCGDDQQFYPDWLDYALESHQEKLGGYGVVGMNDLAYDGNLQVATMWIFDRKYCKEQMGGIFAPPMYNYYCIDSEWNEKAKMLGRFYWDKRSKVEHLHSAHHKRPYDIHDEEKESTDWMVRDAETFLKRKEQGFPVTWNSII